MRYRVTGAESVKPPDATRRVHRGQEGETGDRRWYDWAVGSGDVEPVEPKPRKKATRKKTPPAPDLTGQDL